MTLGGKNKNTTISRYLLEEVTLIERISRAAVAIDITCLGLITYILGALANAWVTYEVPYGSDAFSQLQKVRWILDFWPHVTWSYQWTGGMPLMRWYPPAFYYIVAAFVLLTRSSIEVATISFLFILYFVGAVAVYAFVLRLTGNRQPALIASVLVMISPSIWDQFVIGGTYGRAAALMMLPIALWLVVESVSKPEAQISFVNGEVVLGEQVSRRRSRVVFAALVITLALSILFNPLIGVPTAAITALSILFLRGPKDAIPRILKMVISILCVDASFLFPFFMRQPSNLGAATWGTGIPINFFALSRFPAQESTYLALSPIVVTFTIAVVILSRRVRIEESRKFVGRSYRFLLIFVGLTLFLMLIALTDIGSTVVGYIGLLVAILPFLLAPLAAIHYGRVLTQFPRYSRIITSILILGMLGSIVLVSGVPVTRVLDSSVNSDSSSQILAQIKVDPNEVQYRIGVRGTEGWIGEWWNYRTRVPQTRDYFGQGVLYPDWFAQLNDGVWKTANNYEETNFLLDWWAVRWILVNTQNSDPSKFLARPDLYHFVANISKPPIYEFEYDDSRPILYATNVPTILVIAGDQYREVINDLSYAGLSDSYVVPIHGGAYIDDYSLNDLQHFNAVLLYGYNYHDNATAFNLLNQYVNDGGGLIVDTGYSPDFNSTALPYPFPIESTNWNTHLGTAWDFTWIQNSITADVNFTAFSPAITANLPWGVSASSNSSLRTWAAPIAWDSGLPIMVAGQLGKGRVFWTGMNFFYHLGTYKNYEEAKLLANMIAWASGPRIPNAVGYNATQDNPERMTVTLTQPANGILLKQFWYEDWKATVSFGNGTTEALPIYMAGPDFMYVPLTHATRFPAVVTFTFDSTVDYIGLVISMVALIVLMAYAVVGPRAFSIGNVLVRPFKKLQKKAEEKWVQGD